jgi:predicted nucleic acid-binding protein
MLLAVVDTSVLVSGLLGGNPESPNRRIVDVMLAGTLHFVLSEALLVEYRRVLLRAAIAQRHGLTEDDVDALLESLVLNAGFREPPAAPGEPPAGRDLPFVPGDEHVVALMDASPGAVLITGDHRLAEAVAGRRAVLTPADFAASL